MVLYKNATLSFRGFLILLFLMSRLVIVIALPLEGLKGYGDLAHYFSMANLGIPFIDYWVEYPPIFPYLSWIVYQLSFYKEHVYIYIMVLFFSLCQAGCIWVFLRLKDRLYGEENGKMRGWVYTFISACLAYGWWYFDPLVLLLMLYALEAVLNQKIIRSGITIAMGMLAKWFPLFVLAVPWLNYSWRYAVRIIVLIFVVIFFAYGWLFVESPDLTLASLHSQISKGSWETIWALVDGNLHTGSFGSLVQRFDPRYAHLNVGNPPKISSWVTLTIFCVAGLWLFVKVKFSKGEKQNDVSSIAFLGLTWCLFLLWSPGYSPQWIMYLLPLILLILPERRAILLVFILVLINLLEWPVLLSRGYFWSLWIIVPARTLLILFTMMEFWKASIRGTIAGEITLSEMKTN